MDDTCIRCGTTAELITGSCKLCTVRAMHHMYWDEQMTLREVGREFGLSHERVRILFIEAGLKVRSRKESWTCRTTERNTVMR